MEYGALQRGPAREGESGSACLRGHGGRSAQHLCQVLGELPGVGRCVPARWGLGAVGAPATGRALLLPLLLVKVVQEVGAVALLALPGGRVMPWGEKMHWSRRVTRATKYLEQPRATSNNVPPANTCQEQLGTTSLMCYERHETTSNDVPTQTLQSRRNFALLYSYVYYAGKHLRKKAEFFFSFN